MTLLDKLTNHPSFKKKKRLGRGIGSGVGKTCGRGHKGDGSRSGYKRRHGKIGGAMPLHMKLPIRGGFKREMFKKNIFSLSLELINTIFQDGETVSIETLVEKKIISKNLKPVFKVLSQGEITKKITIEANKFSKQSIKKLEDYSIPYKIR
jgi:large subunit ribosomal protein L15